MVKAAVSNWFPWVLSKFICNMCRKLLDICVWKADNDVLNRVNNSTSFVNVALTYLVALKTVNASFTVVCAKVQSFGNKLKKDGPKKWKSNTPNCNELFEKGNVGITLSVTNIDEHNSW